MLSSKVTLMRRLWRCAGWLAVLTGLLGAAPRHLIWQTGFVRIDPVVLMEPMTWYEAPEHAAAGLYPSSDTGGEHLPRFHHSPQAVLLRVHLLIDAAQGTYTVEHTVNALLAPFQHTPTGAVRPTPYAGSPQQVLPWLAYLPAPVSFAVQGRSLYYRDAEGKSHKASIIHGVP